MRDSSVRLDSIPVISTCLETIRVTQDSADQRRGNEPAGWNPASVTVSGPSRSTKRSWLAAPRKSSTQTSPLLLDTAQWGVSDPSELSWLTPSPSGTVAQARELLTRLGALDATGRLTPHGRQMGEAAASASCAHAAQIGPVGLRPTRLRSRRAPQRARPAARPLVRQTDVRLRLDLLYGHRGEATAASVDRRAIERGAPPISGNACCNR